MDYIREEPGGVREEPGGIREEPGGIQEEYGGARVEEVVAAPNASLQYLPGFTLRDISTPVQYHQPPAILEDTPGTVIWQNFNTGKDEFIGGADRKGADAVAARKAQKGVAGQKGTSGRSGSGTGASGSSGSSGTSGLLGENGETGYDGMSGGTMRVTILPNPTDPSGIQILTHGYGASLASFSSSVAGANNYYLLDCSGGSGGNGGTGGDGGTGGSGGPGGSGATGRRGGNTSSTCNGGPGGNGGNGGSAGGGGKGGKGGRGGPGGVGGRITIKTQHPELLMLVKANVLGGPGGRGGVGGKGGQGGTGGSGGSGGAGGAPGHYTTYHTDSNGNRRSTTHTGRRGRRGANGAKGRNGASGSHGDGGTVGIGGRAGLIEYHILNEKGQTVISSNYPYNVAIEGLTFTSELNDGFFYPGLKMRIEAIQVRNTGGIPLPAGAVVSFSSPSIASSNTIALPAMLPGQSLLLPTPLDGYIAPAPPPTSVGTATRNYPLFLGAHFMGRLFTASGSDFNIKSVYPIRFVSKKILPQMTRGSTAQLKVVLANDSPIAYGVSPSTVVAVRFEFDPRLSATSRKQEWDDKAGKFYLDVPVVSFGPKSNYEIVIPIEMGQNVEFFEKIPWRATLFLREQLIEYVEGGVDLSPNYDKDFVGLLPSITLFTGRSMSRSDYLGWDTILSSLSLPYSVWDYDLYGGLAPRGDTSWHPSSTTTKDRRSLFFLFRTPSERDAVLNTMDWRAISDHFQSFRVCHDVNLSDDVNYNIKNKSGFEEKCPDIVSWPFEDAHGVLMESSVSTAVRLELFPLQKAIVLGNDRDTFYGTDTGSHGIKNANEKAAEILKYFTKENPLFNFTIRSKDFKLTRVDTVKKYSYGTLTIAPLPIRKRSRLLTAGTSPGPITSLSDYSVKRQVVSLTDTVGKYYLHTLATIPFAAKMSVLSSPAMQWEFQHSVNLCLTEIISLAIYSECVSDWDDGDKDKPYNQSFSFVVTHLEEISEDAAIVITYVMDRIHSHVGLTQKSKVNSWKDLMKDYLYESQKFPLLAGSKKTIKGMAETYISNHKKNKITFESLLVSSGLTHSLV